MITWILLAILILLLLAAIPAWPYSRAWGWGPGGVISLLLLVLIVAWLIGAI